jgi:hypothetical protein
LRAVTFELVFANDPADRRSAEEVNDVCQALIATVEKTHGQAGVKLR